MAATHGERSAAWRRWWEWRSTSPSPPEHGGGGPARDQRADGGGGPGLSPCAAPKTPYWLTCCAELDRRQGWRASGATSLGSWLVQQLGVSDATARAYAEVARHSATCRILAAGLAEGRLNLDKVRCVLAVAGARQRGRVGRGGRELSFKDLRRWCGSKQAHPRVGRADEEKRSVRFNDACAPWWPSCPRSPTPRCAPCSRRGPSRSARTARRPRPAPGRRLGLAVLGAGTSGSARVPRWWPTCPSRSGRPGSTLPGELEPPGLSAPTWRGGWPVAPRLIVALDDAWATPCTRAGPSADPTPTQRREVRRRDRHCVFPGCAHVLFTNCHHIEAWQHGGQTDLDNLVLLCAPPSPGPHEGLVDVRRRQRRAALRRPDRPGHDQRPSRPGPRSATPRCSPDGAEGPSGARQPRGRAGLTGPAGRSGAMTGRAVAQPEGRRRTQKVDQRIQGGSGDGGAAPREQVTRVPR